MDARFRSLALTSMEPIDKGKDNQLSSQIYVLIYGANHRVEGVQVT
jgi:hypothetical protein